MVVQKERDTPGNAKIHKRLWSLLELWGIWYNFSQDPTHPTFLMTNSQIFLIVKVLLLLFLFKADPVSLLEPHADVSS